ncbi:MAG: S8 family serine peptidase [Candidatus Doudnabacteria bacterium]|nr:S8 family serine peptidase [Candidatus Doudnabacteria bacterium]
MLINLKTKLLSLVVILLVFLFAGTFEHNATSVKIIFALKEGVEVQDIVVDYQLLDNQLLFAASKGLAPTFTAAVKSGLLGKLNSDKRLLYAEADTKVLASKITTNDSFFTTDDNNQNSQWYLPKIKIPDAWEFSKGSSSVKVAIVDTGIHASHIELNDGRVIGGYNSITKETILPQASSDDNGHGTAVAGIIGAIPNNGRGLSGINWNISLMPIKALDAAGNGFISSVASGIVRAVDEGADIINLSLGGPGFGADATLNSAVKYAFDRGVLVVAAAGNDLAEFGSNLDINPVYPICSDLGQNMVLGVAATDVTDQKADFSNFGINCVDLSAPGKRILTTAFIPSDPANNILIYGSGTSLATPLVSGVAALLKAKNPTLTNIQLRDILIKSVDDISNLNKTNCLGTSCNGFLGSGRLNALKALTPTPFSDGDLIRESGTNRIFLLTDGTKHYVSQFVFDQKGFSLANVVNETSGQLSTYTEGAPLLPVEGTLIKAENNPTVYIIHENVKRALTFLVFNSRKFSFADVRSLPSPDVALFPEGDWFWPPDGTMVLVSSDPTVYVMDQEVRRPVTFLVFNLRKLSFANVVTVSPDELTHIPVPEDSYWLAPPEGTLVKSVSDPTVYTIENASRRGLTGVAFTNRGLSFGAIHVLPQAELEVIKPGDPIIE